LKNLEIEVELKLRLEMQASPHKKSKNQNTPSLRMKSIENLLCIYQIFAVLRFFRHF
jgi:hypothetical protein